MLSFSKLRYAVSISIPNNLFLLIPNSQARFQPDIVTFHFHDDVKAKGFHLDQASYGTLIDGLCKIGETRAAVKFLRKNEEKFVLGLM